MKTSARSCQRCELARVLLTTFNKSKNNINAASCKLSGKDHTGSPGRGRQAPPIHHNRPKSELKCLSTKQGHDQNPKCVVCDGTLSKADTRADALPVPGLHSARFIDAILMLRFSRSNWCHPEQKIPWGNFFLLNHIDVSSSADTMLRWGQFSSLSETKFLARDAKPPFPSEPTWRENHRKKYT